MTLIEFIDAVLGLGILVVLGCILVELRDWRMTATLRESKRRRWVSEEHRGDD